MDLKLYNFRLLHEAFMSVRHQFVLHRENSLQFKRIRLPYSCLKNNNATVKKKNFTFICFPSIPISITLKLASDLFLPASNRRGPVIPRGIFLL